MPAFILIHPTVWRQHASVTDRQDRQDNGPIAWGEPFYKRLPKNKLMYSKAKDNVDSGLNALKELSFNRGSCLNAQCKFGLKLVCSD